MVNFPGHILSVAVPRGTRLTAANFWARVELVRGVRKFAFPGCWEWQGGRFRNGYGRIYELGKRIGAHRVAWTFEHGAIPEGLHVLHRCDNPRCVRPDHLFLGTTAENMQDMARKKRAAYQGVRGERHPSARLSDAQVRAIRERYRRGLSVRLARAYGVHPSTVSLIVTGKLRPEAGGPIVPVRARRRMR